MKTLLQLKGYFSSYQHSFAVLMEKKQDFWREPDSHFHSVLIQPLLYLQGLQNVTAAAGRTKTLFSMESSFPSAPLSDHREVGLSTLSDRHRIRWLNKTPSDSNSVFWICLVGWRLPFQYQPEQWESAVACFHFWTVHIQKSFLCGNPQLNHCSL